MSDQSDKTRLQTAAKALMDELRKRHLHNSFRIKLGKLEDEPTGGWAIRVATWTGHPDVDLWLDKFLGDKKRHFWFGFYSSEANKVKSVKEEAPEARWPAKDFSDDDVVGGKKGGIRRLRERPSEKDITHSISETYKRTPSFFFGMYDTGNHGSPDRLQLDAPRAASFIGDVVNSVSGEDPGVPEGRVRHVHLEQRCRNSRYARECKERDKYRCQVCGFRFEDWYGDILGKQKFAEAHHTMQLSQLRGQTHVKKTDLITVCANCHRMLDRMSGKQEDVKRLQAIARPLAVALTNALSKPTP